MSVAVEAQTWAANFYGDGGVPSVLIKSAIPLGGTLDDDPDDEDADPMSEADRLRAQWVDRPNNVPRVIDDSIESVEYFQPNPSGAQMLEARNYNNGDAARMFGIPGTLLEYSTPGSSLTYQNIEGEYTKFVRTCLAPNYLEPIEQAFSDLLPRSTVVRFRTAGLYRADAATRWSIYESMARVLGVDRAAEIAAVEEDIEPGNREAAPVLFAPPSAVPASLPKVRTEAPAPVEFRCTGTRIRRQGGASVMAPCGKLLAESGTFVGRCPRCKRDYPVAA